MDLFAYRWTKFTEMTSFGKCEQTTSFTNVEQTTSSPPLQQAIWSKQGFKGKR